MEFISPTQGRLTLQQVLEDLSAYVSAIPTATYKVIIGSDSHVRDRTCLVTAIIVHRVGKGARYYFSRRMQRKITSLRQKIFYETSLSLEVTQAVKDFLQATGLINRVKIEVHVDVGTSGDTRLLIKEVVGMVTGSGFEAKIKPDSFGASKVADKHTK